MKNKQKLTLRKEKIASLSTTEMKNLNGGRLGGSTEHNFLCGLCTGGQTREASCAKTCFGQTCSINGSDCLQYSL